MAMRTNSNSDSPGNMQAGDTTTRSSPKPLRVVLVCGTETLGNLSPVIRHLTVGLLDEPIQIFLTCPIDTDTTGIPTPPVQIIRYRKSFISLLHNRSIDALLEHLSGAGISLLHALDTDALGITQKLSARLDLDYVVGVYSLAAHVRNCATPTSPAGRRCRAILAGSQPIYQNLLKVRSIPADIVHLLRPGVHQASEPTCFVKPDNAVAIVAGGNLDDYKHFAAVLESFTRLRETHHDCIFFLVGQGPAERHLRELSAKLNLVEDLTFVGYLGPDEINGILRAADIFLSPRPTDRVEINLLSAMAAGVPVLAAGAKACDFIIDGQTALTFQPGDASEITAKVTALLDDHAFAQNLAKTALEYLKENHSPSRMTAQILRLYHSVINKNRPAE